MIRKTEQYRQAVELRKRGFTYEEIAKIVGVAKSTISAWISRETWSKKHTDDNIARAARENSKRMSLLNTVRGKQNSKRYQEAEKSAEIEFKHYKHNPLFIAGIMLYVAGGDTKDIHTIRLGSANIELHRIFLNFTEEFMGVSRERVRFWLLLYPDQNPTMCATKWSKQIRLPINHFGKYQTIGEKSSKHALRFGVGNTIIGDTVLKRKLMKWAVLLTKGL